MEFFSSLGDPHFESKLPYLTVILVTLIALFVGYFKVFLLLGKKLPPGSVGFPLIGETLSFLRAQKQDKTNEWIRSRINKYGPVFKTSLMGSKVVVLTGQAGNRFMFSGGDNGIASNQPVSVARILGKHSFFELSGPRHKLVRGAIMSFLKPESIQRYVGEMDSLIQQQIKQELNGKDSIKFTSFIKKITFKVTSSLLFGLPDGKEKDQLKKDFKILIKGAWTIPMDFPGTTFRKALQARGRICRLLSDLAKKRKEKLTEEQGGEGGSSDHEDVISVFINLRDENGKPLQEEEIIDAFISLIIASHDTTTVVLCFLVRQLARDAEILDKVLQEQKEVVKAREQNDGNITWNEVQMMKYTWRVAQEIMRMTPPALGNFKCAWRDTNFGGFDIPKGWQVFWVSSGTQMDEKIFEEPEKFDPSRFDSSSKSFPPYTYIAFGAGPRICPGAEFARVELLLIIHHLITNYGWTEMIPNEAIIRKPMPYPAMGLPIKLYPRKPE